MSQLNLRETCQDSTSREGVLIVSKGGDCSPKHRYSAKDACDVKVSVDSCDNKDSCDNSSRERPSRQRRSKHVSKCVEEVVEDSDESCYCSFNARHRASKTCCPDRVQEPQQCFDVQYCPPPVAEDCCELLYCLQAFAQDAVTSISFIPVSGTPVVFSTAAGTLGVAGAPATAAVPAGPNGVPPAVPATQPVTPAQEVAACPNLPLKVCAGDRFAFTYTNVAGTPNAIAVVANIGGVVFRTFSPSLSPQPNQIVLAAPAGSTIVDPTVAPTVPMGSAVTSSNFVSVSPNGTTYTVTWTIPPCLPGQPFGQAPAAMSTSTPVQLLDQLLALLPSQLVTQLICQLLSQLPSPVLCQLPPRLVSQLLAQLPSQACQQYFPQAHQQQCPPRRSSQCPPQQQQQCPPQWQLLQCLPQQQQCPSQQQQQCPPQQWQPRYQSRC
jgi:hypothetical protein